ncbi:hypothetical protein D0525_23915 [Salmonella enterica]|uniref:hypothetical protein n=1 Tax=Salmonella enterica TaxID=28901 RepID=UPI0010137CD1|nr:hypothetical protein [Salmonella enterica]RXO32060.1 hypothetical protein D0525_23915 [Salmonella enterica]
MKNKQREIIKDVFKRMEYYSTETKILYYTSDNRVLKRTGGPRNWRLNNPGNIDFAGTTNIQKGRIGKAFIPGGKKKVGGNILNIMRLYLKAMRQDVRLKLIF